MSIAIVRGQVIRQCLVVFPTVSDYDSSGSGGRGWGDGRGVHSAGDLLCVCVGGAGGPISVRFAFYFA